MKHAVLAVALLAGSAPARAEAPKRPRLAVLGLRAISVDEAKADLLSEVALTEASRFRSLDVIGRSDVAAILGFERQRRLLGCKEDAACMAELGGALGADYLLAGSLGRIGNLLRLDLRLLDARKARVLGRFGESIEGEEDRLLTAMQQGVAELVGPVGGEPPAPPQTRAQPAAPARARSAGPVRVAERRVRFNGKALIEEQARTLARLELAIGQLPDGEYWYDARTGASGRWGGPTLAFLPAGLDLGGPLPANASGGGQGTVTGVFINGRELHPIDVLGLREILGVVLPGRWWVDSQGTYGLEGGPALGNLVLLAQQRRAMGQGGSRAWSRRYEGATPGDNMNLASDGTTTCVSVSGYSRCTGE